MTVEAYVGIGAATFVVFMWGYISALRSIRNDMAECINTVKALYVYNTKTMKQAEAVLDQAFKRLEVLEREKGQ